MRKQLVSYSDSLTVSRLCRPNIISGAHIALQIDQDKHYSWSVTRNIIHYALHFILYYIGMSRLFVWNCMSLHLISESPYWELITGSMLGFINQTKCYKYQPGVGGGETSLCRQSQCLSAPTGEWYQHYVISAWEVELTQVKTSDFVYLVKFT